jgi:uncharacterized NAD-dependent epimerase/dehydratase family protein
MKDAMLDGNAIVYCEGGFNTLNGKTAHGLVRFTRRYRVLALVDSGYAGQDAGTVLDGKSRGIPVVGTLDEALTYTGELTPNATHFVMGLAPDGGRLSAQARMDVRWAIEAGLHVDCGLHDFLSDDPELMALAASRQVTIRDIRKPPHRSELHSFSGRIEQVQAKKIAILGTDSAVGKRTTAWLLAQGLQAAGFKTELVGTGQTAWMQGARYSVILDSLVNDFVSGEIEHAVWRCWSELKPDVIIVEGQGSLMNPAYPGGVEILAAARPDFVVLQHAPARKEYDGFPGYPIHPLSRQIEAIETISCKPVRAVTINHEEMTPAEIPLMCSAIRQLTGLPAHDVLVEGADGLVDSLRPYLR